MSKRHQVVSDECQALASLVDHWRVTKEALPRPARLPPLPKIDGAAWLRMPEEERPARAEQEARQWAAATLKQYRRHGWLDDETEAAIITRAQVHYRTLTGRDIAPEALRAPYRAIEAGGHVPVPQAALVTPAGRQRTYRRGRRALPMTVGPSELRKAGAVVPRQ